MMYFSLRYLLQYCQLIVLSRLLDFSLVICYYLPQFLGCNPLSYKSPASTEVQLVIHTHTVTTATDQPKPSLSSAP